MTEHRHVNPWIVAINRELLEELKLRESRNRAAEARLRKVEYRRTTDDMSIQGRKGIES